MQVKIINAPLAKAEEQANKYVSGLKKSQTLLSTNAVTVDASGTFYLILVIYHE
jgi:hypothetical protein